MDQIHLRDTMKNLFIITTCLIVIVRGLKSATNNRHGRRLSLQPYLSNLYGRNLVMSICYTIVLVFSVAGVSSSGQEDEVRFDFVCEHRTLNISCNADETIQITDALYGYDWDDSEPRMNCTDQIGISEGQLCAAESSKVKVSSMCNNKTACSVMATNAVFGDPCVGTFKYMRVNYTCVSHSPDAVTCQEYTSSPVDADPPGSVTLWPIVSVSVIPLLFAILIYLAIQSKREKRQPTAKPAKNHELSNNYAASTNELHIYSSVNEKDGIVITESAEYAYAMTDGSGVSHNVISGHAETDGVDLPGESVYNAAYGAY